MNPDCSPCIWLQPAGSTGSPAWLLTTVRAAYKQFVPPPVPPLTLSRHPCAAGQGITYHKQSRLLWCFFFWPQYFWLRRCNSLCQKAGLAWWSGYDQWWCKNCGLPQDQSPLHSSATPPWGFQRAREEAVSQHRSHQNAYSICDYTAHFRERYKSKHLMKVSPDTSCQLKQNTTSEMWDNTLHTYPFLQVPFPPAHPHESILSCLWNVNAPNFQRLPATVQRQKADLRVQSLRQGLRKRWWYLRTTSTNREFPYNIRKPQTAETSPDLFCVLSN